ncbi:MAG TPA: archaeosortase/exosortase family protein [Candidatus Binatia bacterium]|nr:archaeosortase/exosortase family protein [Candidatus Binatia bacterium]
MLRRLLAALAANWLTIRVVGAFILLIVVFFSAMTYTPLVRRFDIASLIAQLAAWMAWLLLKVLGLVVGFDIFKNGTILGSGPFEVDVSPACSGAVPTMIYLAAVFAYPASGRAKLIGAALGMAIIHTVNVIRVSSLFLIGLYFHRLFHETHVYVAQALVVAIAVATWLYWAGRFADAPGR